MRNQFFELSYRDVLCFGFALGLHSILLLWRGGVFSLSPAAPQSLGDMIVEVGYLSEVPNYDQPAGGGATAPAPKRSFLSKMESLLHHPAPAQPKQQRPHVDAFSQHTFQPAGQTDALRVATGNSQNAAAGSISGGSHRSASLVSRKDVPFPVAQSVDPQENVNMVPINAGEHTSSEIIEPMGGGNSGSRGTGTKRLASKDALPTGFSGAASGGSGSGSSAGASGLAMGSGSSSASGGDSGGLPGGFGASGSGAGGGSGHALQDAGGGMGDGMSFGGMPHHNQFATDAQTVQTGANRGAKRSNFNITGALAGRAITSKHFPKYEQDGRVALRFQVDWSGSVLDGILVEVSSGSPSFDQKVIAALKEWKFAPLTATQSDVTQQGVITITFKGV